MVCPRSAGARFTKPGASKLTRTVDAPAKVTSAASAESETENKSAKRPIRAASSALNRRAKEKALSA